jgi:heat-inducible transcriptional repressor
VPIGTSADVGGGSVVAVVVGGRVVTTGGRVVAGAGRRVVAVAAAVVVVSTTGAGARTVVVVVDVLDVVVVLVSVSTRRGASLDRLGNPAMATPNAAPTSSNRARAQPGRRTGSEYGSLRRWLGTGSRYHRVPTMRDERLDDRKSAILRAVVEEYIETAQPVGSGTVARTARVQVSSATVRNEMAVLERDGYLVQPHTSAGRIPTDKGYRFFVDQLAPGNLAPSDRNQVSNFFGRTHGELEQMLHDTSQLLAGLTTYAAVIVGPQHEVATIRSIQLVALGPRVALLVAVLSNGAVEKRTVELPDNTGEDRVGAASAHLSAHLTGRVVADLGVIPATGDAATDSLADAAVTHLSGTHDDEPDHVFVGGASRMAAAFDAVETVRQVLGILEEQYVVVSLLRDVLNQGLSVAIGAEHGFQPLAECSVVVAPYDVEGEHAGTIGVLGPTRMNYPQALAAVAVVGQRLSRHLSDG